MSSLGRKALAQRGGPTRVRGETHTGQILAQAWEAAAREDEDTLTHGFHAYPARMHWAVARTLITRLGRPGATLLDPFCGSGTALVEAMVGGLDPVGIDLNPVALRVAGVKADLRALPERERFEANLRAVVEASLERVRSRVAAMAPVRGNEVRYYDPHVLKELAGLHAEIERLRPSADRRAASVLLSSIVVKFSRQRADTAAHTVGKRIGKGIPTRFFERKGRELLQRWEALSQSCDPLPKVYKPRFVEADARRLPEILGTDIRADLVVTSPPYGGTYDYAEHHARRYPWLGVSSRRLRDQEIGARRHYGGRSSGAAGRERWDAEVRDVLRSMARVMKRGAVAVWVMGDGQLGRERVPADLQLEALAPEVGLRVLAVASQERLDWKGGRPRGEHLIAMTSS